jgi:quinol monooxygenase YgiN
MLRRLFGCLAAVVFLATPIVVRAQGDYLDVFRVKVKPEKSAEFNTLTKKWVDANRRYSGDHWLALETVYGEGDVYVFTSIRGSYADIDKGNEASMGAARKAFGPQIEKVMQDFESCLASSRSELRRRRWDLSRKAPADAAAYTKLIGESRYLRTTAVHVRPGHVADFEALLKDMKAAGEKTANTQPVFVSQAIEGAKGTIFYVSTLRSSMGGFDNNPSMRDILGEEGYKKFLQGNADFVEEADSTLFRLSPELSNPPDDVVAVAPGFWRPKPAAPAAAAKSKPKE